MTEKNHVVYIKRRYCHLRKVRESKNLKYAFFENMTTQDKKLMRGILKTDNTVFLTNHIKLNSETASIDVNYLTEPVVYKTFNKLQLPGESFFIIEESVNKLHAKIRNKCNYRAYVIDKDGNIKGHKANYIYSNSLEYLNREYETKCLNLKDILQLYKTGVLKF